eukprot:6192357-Pleurochrysis_carterae.AAC.4
MSLKRTPVSPCPPKSSSRSAESAAACPLLGAGDKPLINGSAHVPLATLYTCNVPSGRVAEPPGVPPKRYTSVPTRVAEW